MPYITSPRLFVSIPLYAGGEINLPAQQAHYLRSVMRKGEGAIVRAFNANDGEFLTTLKCVGKRDAVLQIDKILRAPKTAARKIHLITPILKKDRMDMLIEKAVELGMTDLHPIICERSDIRELKIERVNAQLIEAAEQSERLTIPTLHPICKLRDFEFLPQTYAALERTNAAGLSAPSAGDISLLIGAAGGWSEDEKIFLLNVPNITPISLGENILRAETAAIAMLAKLLP